MPSIAHGLWYAEEGNLGCVALAVSFSGFHSGCRLICCTDWTVMLISSLLWRICSSLDSGLLATAVKVSKSRHNSTLKSLIQNSPIQFQDNIALSLHCTFQSLNVQWVRRKCEQYLAEWLTHSHTHTRWLPYASGGLCPLRHDNALNNTCKTGFLAAPTWTLGELIINGSEFNSCSLAYNKRKRKKRRRRRKKRRRRK